MLPANGTRVRVHLNLHRARAGMPDAWSVTIAGRVVANVARVALCDAMPRFLASKQSFSMVPGNKRTVHAWLEGTLCAPATGTKTEITYNPKRSAAFHTRDGRLISHCARVEFTPDHKAWIIE